MSVEYIDEVAVRQKVNVYYHPHTLARVKDTSEKCNCDLVSVQNYMRRKVNEEEVWKCVLCRNHYMCKQCLQIGLKQEQQVIKLIGGKIMHVGI